MTEFECEAGDSNPYDHKDHERAEQEFEEVFHNNRSLVTMARIRPINQPVVTDSAETATRKRKVFISVQTKRVAVLPEDGRI